MSNDFEYKGLKIKIRREEDPRSPSEDGDNDVFLVANHRSFYVPEPGAKRVPDSAKEVVDTYKKSHWVFQLEAYIHSGVRLALSGEGNFPDRQWDVSQLGYVFVAKSEKRLRKSARKVAVSLVETWNQYLSGDIWGFIIEDENGETLESCWGFYGLEYCKEQATESAKTLRK